MRTPRWEEAYCLIDLDHPPEVVAISKNVHYDDPEESFCLPELWSLHIYEYEAELQMDQLMLPIREGYVGLTPPGAQTTYRYAGKTSPHLFVHFRLPSADAETGVLVRAMQDLGGLHEEVYEDLAEVIPVMQVFPERVNARVWDVLWRVFELPGGSDLGLPGHRAVRKAVDVIERRLHEPVSVKELAESVGVSYGYLGKLFDAEFGESVVGYVRRRRMERAVHLLVNSTFPIKYVAGSVGLPDLQHFNKAVREFAGKSPRRVREEGAGAPPPVS